MFSSRYFLFLYFILFFLGLSQLSSAADIDECKNSTVGQCSPKASCMNTNGSFVCKCNNGYKGNGTSCEDIDECNNSTLHDCSKNAICNNTDGNFTCTCNSGFNGNGTVCEDIDECQNSTLSQCAPKASCMNTNGSFVCKCNNGYKGNGTSCDDIDECNNSTLHDCSKNAICNNTDGNFTCTCNSGFNGNGTVCEDIDECNNSTLHDCSKNAICNNTDGSFTCTCESGFNGNGTVCEDIDECNNSTLHDCSKNAICNNTDGSFTCTCKSGFNGNGTVCEDIDECQNSTLSQCAPKASCMNTNGSFVCKCNNGYKGNGTFCDDIDECNNSTLHDCSKNAICNNTDGSFTCTCKSGFNGNGTVCEDIDECLFSFCPPDADCVNTEGSVTCTCKDGYKGNGTYCEDKDECKDGSQKCDVNADCKNIKGSYECLCKKGFRGNGKQCDEIPLFPYYNVMKTSKKDVMYGPFDMYGDINAFRFLFSTVYVSQNGYITLGSDPKIRAQPTIDHSFPKKVVIFAPFWTSLDLSGKGKIFVDDYKSCKAKDRQMLSAINKSLKNVTAKRALVVTWENVSPYPASEFSNETITFQAVLVSNENKLYVVFNYDKDQIKMNKEANARRILIGYFDGKTKFENLASGKNIYNWLEEPTKGFTGKRYFKKVGESNETSMICLDWFCENEEKTLPLVNAAIPCPCTRQQAEKDYTFKSVANSCFQMVFARNDVMQTCCYDDKWGALLLGFPGGGNTYNETEKTDLVTGQQHCCTDYKLCNLFYDVYPSSNCSSYKAPKEVLIWDPLVFKSVSSGEILILYGSGEYNLIDTTSLKLQARIEMKKNTVTPAILSEIPVYTAFAIQFGQEKVVFTTDGSTISATPSQTKNIKVSDISKEKLVRTPMMQMKVMLIEGQIGVVVILPDFESSALSGLLSATLKDGKTPSEKVYKTFEAWKLSSQNDSAFTYTPAKNFSTINSYKVDLKQFQEINSNLTKLLQENSNKSKDICKMANVHCMMQLLLKNVSTILTAEEAQIEQQQILGNFPPVFENASPTILVHKSIVKKIEAKDPENGNVTITLETKLKTDSYQFKNNEFNLTLNSSQLPLPTYIKFFATDSSKATSLYWPEVFLCTCRDRSECQESSMHNKRRLRFSQGNNENNTEARMSRLPCDCKEGYTGTTCEKEIQICTNTTCYPEVHCNKTNPSSPCGPCPSGMEGDGVKCYDVNQCSKGVCGQNCKDYLGSKYTCSCHLGFVLAADNKTCLDIDECQDGNNNCTGEGEYCENTKGSFSCKCAPGYIEVNSSCLSLKGKTKLAGSLAFVATPNTERAWSEDLKDDSSPKFKKLAEELKTSLLAVFPKGVDMVKVTSFEKVDSQQKRKKRSVNPQLTKGNFEVIGSNVKAKQLEDSLKTNCKSSYCEVGNFKGITPNSISLQVASLCPNSPCDLISTVCVEQNGYKCECKTGFEKLMSNDERCKDIDECTKNPCGSVTCNNTIGSYKCTCDYGFIFNNDTKKCVDVCSGDVCNQGTCIKTEYSFRCSCKDGWKGEKCEKKDSESEQMKNNLIIVGAVLGSFCLIFLIIIIIMCCRSKSEKSNDLPPFYETGNSWKGLPRARLRDVEMNENGSRLDLTKNTNTYDSLPGIQNPAFDPDENRVDRC